MIAMGTAAMPRSMKTMRHHGRLIEPAPAEADRSCGWLARPLDETHRMTCEEVGGELRWRCAECQLSGMMRLSGETVMRR